MDDAVLNVGHVDAIGHGHDDRANQLVELGKSLETGCAAQGACFTLLHDLVQGDRAVEQLHGEEGDGRRATPRDQKPA